ncbi:hypothetical protein AWC27_02695 [Mycobacterium szulgai]|uniref:Uncharacterized protein n=1 Tax=Mycobacterium szulgai TaxID=1787 RepID=A0A1X2EEL7_MYCSZ|nr:hypothetical protein AWC27_02695 [Mycobacterium szulgai]
MTPFHLGERLWQRHLVAHRIAVSADDVTQLAHPAESFVANVPHQAQPPARPQHPGHFRNRPRGINPVPSLGHQHRVNAVVRQRYFLRGAEQRNGFR